ncbi:hypothetical protein EMCG_06914 [[Emmonsia] crescens]|uniref:Uncharacterized protein n=1 Tax=[Emmonsia] crescens TaxID=73230 RepID=A0A0G2J695_9EURO|nr:hypothetical protein EMCG_06914 [Emmonsia crescens UAMH 3008]
MAFFEGDDDPRGSNSDQESNYNDGCFSDAGDAQTDHSSGPERDDESDEEDSDDDGEWLQNTEDHSPEHYIQLEASLEPSTLRQLRYSPNTQARLDWVEEHWERYCSYIRRSVIKAYNNISIRTLYSFLCWVCDRRQGQNGRRRGIKRLSSLQTFWKWFQMVYKAKAGRRIDQMIITQSQDLLRFIAKEKGLSEEGIKKGTMYVQDLAELCRVLLATTEMLFLVGYLRIQLILFCHFAGYTANRPSAVLDVRLGDLELTLVRDTIYGRPRLVVKVTFDYTRFLGKKASDTFTLSEIIYDPSLILSPHVFLLGMLFHFQAFKSPSLTSPERLYDLGVLEGLNQQKLPLRDDLRDKFLFCEAVREGETAVNPYIGYGVPRPINCLRLVMSFSLSGHSFDEYWKKFIGILGHSFPDPIVLKTPTRMQMSWHILAIAYMHRQPSGFEADSPRMLEAPLIYVNDLHIIAETPSDADWLIETFASKLEIKDLKEPAKYLSMEVTREKRGIRLALRRYISQLIEDSHLEDAVAIRAPMDESLQIDDNPVSEKEGGFTKQRYQQVLDVYSIWQSSYVQISPARRPYWRRRTRLYCTSYVIWRGLVILA